MGIKSFVIKTNTKKEFNLLDMAESTIADILDFDPLFRICGGIRKNKNHYSLIELNCSHGSALSVIDTLLLDYGLRVSPVRLEDLPTTKTLYGSKINGAFYYKNVDSFYKNLK